MALGPDKNPIHTTCPRCGHSNETAALASCRHCGTDATIHIKAMSMSDVYYNKGLAAANARAMTDAIAALTTSLLINKKNIKARNLLGLVFYAVGRLGEALREWVISVNYDGEGDDNPAKGYLEVFNIDTANLDKYSEGLRNYNEALHYLKQRNDDMALIRLKRAVELIPNFVDAINLLTLVHIRDGDKMRAGGLVERALRIDATNPLAHRYYSEIFRKKATAGKRAESDDGTVRPGAPQTRGTTPAVRQSDKERPAQNNLFGVQNKQVFKRRSPLVSALWFFVGLGAMFLVMHFVVMPSALDGANDDNYDLERQLAYNAAAHNAVVTELETTIAQHETDLAAAADLAAAQANRITDLQHENWVNIAHGHMLEQMHAQALTVLDNVDSSRLSPESFVIFTIVRDTSMPVMELQYHNAGRGFFDGGNNDLARENLERAVMLITDGSTVADWSFYLLGRIAEADGDFELARQFYETILEDFPGSNRVNAATLRLNAISQ